MQSNISVSQSAVAGNMFIFNLTYIKHILEVEKMLPAHISYLEENYNAKKFICSGRNVGRRIEGDANCELFFQPLSH